MAFHLFNRRRPSVGMHFGEHWLTGVVLVQGGELIKRCEGVELVDFDSEEAAAQALIGMLDARGGSVTSNAPHEQVFARVVQMDAELDDVDIHEQMQIAATEALEIDLVDIAFDYSVQGVSYAQEAKADVLLFACPMEVVRQREAMLQRSGLKVRAIEPQEHSLQRAYCNMVRDLPDAHHRYVTAMLAMSREQIDVWMFRGRSFEGALSLPTNSGWQRLWDSSKATKALKSLCSTETRSLCEHLHAESKQRVGERIARWLLLPSNTSRHIADSLQQVDSPVAIIEMRPNPDSDKANQIPSEGVIMAFGLALAGAGA